MGTATTTIRLKRELREEVERIARRTRRSFAEVAQDLMEEALRMRSVPGIYFSQEPAGREAKIAGTGLAVWEVAAVLAALSGDERALHSRFDWLSQAQVKAALLYYGKFREEIDSLIADNEECARAQDQGILPAKAARAKAARRR